MMEALTWPQAIVACVGIIGFVVIQWLFLRSRE